MIATQNNAAYTDNLPFILLHPYHLSHSEKFGESFYSVDMVGTRGGLAARMHCPKRCSHIDTSKRYLGSEYIAECRAAGHVAVVYEVLNRNSGPTAYFCEYGSRIGIGHILAVCVYLDARATAEHRMVCRVLFLHIVGMYAMRIVCRNHERIGNSTHKVALRTASGIYNRAKYMLEHR